MFNFLVKRPVCKVNYTQNFLRNYFIMRIGDSKTADEVHYHIKNAKKQLEKDNLIVVERYALDKLSKIDACFGGMRASEEDIARAQKFDKEN